jgi:hypothetical protein
MSARARFRDQRGDGCAERVRGSLEAPLRLADTYHRRDGIGRRWRRRVAGLAADQEPREVQSAVMARETLVTRVAAIELRREITCQKMSSITNEFMARLHPYANEHDKEPPYIDTEWAGEGERIANGVVAVLIAHQETSFDGESIDAKRKATIQQAKMLSDCLSKIYIPYSTDLEDPEWNLTTDEITAVEEDGARAEKNLENHISSVSKSAGDLDAAFRTGLNQLRSRIRRIDALVTHDKRSSD